MPNTRTLEVLYQYLDTGSLPDITEVSESKAEMKEYCKKEFENLLATEETNPLLAFQVLYHRLGEIANVAKEVFYDAAVEFLKENETGEYFGIKSTLKVTDQYEVVKSPKMLKLEKEIDQVEKKNEKIIRNFEKYKQDVKSLQSQIKAEKQRLIDQGMGTKKDSSYVISLSY